MGSGRLRIGLWVPSAVSVGRVGPCAGGGMAGVGVVPPTGLTLPENTIRYSTISERERAVGAGAVIRARRYQPVEITLRFALGGDGSHDV